TENPFHLAQYAVTRSIELLQISTGLVNSFPLPLHEDWHVPEKRDKTTAYGIAVSRPDLFERCDESFQFSSVKLAITEQAEKSLVNVPFPFQLGNHHGGVHRHLSFAGTTDRSVYPLILSNTFFIIRCTRSSGPWGRPWWEIGGMCPGGAERPCAQKIVDALNTKFPFGPG